MSAAGDPALDLRPLGTAGPLVSPLFLGTWPIGGGMGPLPRSVALATIGRALELGVTGIDTAEGYGNAEELLGEAIAPRERPNVFLATKVSFGPYTVRRVRDAVEQSLRRLRTDHVDLLQLHFYPAEVELEEALDALEAVRAASLTRFVGLSNFDAGQLRRAASIAPLRSIQVPLNLFDRDELAGSIATARAEGLGVLTHSSLAKGLLTGSLTAASRFAASDERSRNPRFGPETLRRYLEIADRLAALAREADMELVELAIAWALAQPGVTACIAGPSSPAELDAQRRGAAMRIDPDLLARATAIASDAPSIGHGTPTRSPALSDHAPAPADRPRGGPTDRLRSQPPG